MPDKAAMLDKAAFAKSVHEIGDEFWEDWCDSKAAEAYALEQKIDASFVDGMHRDESDMAAEKAPWAVANVSGAQTSSKSIAPETPEIKPWFSDNRAHGINDCWGALFLFKN